MCTLHLLFVRNKAILMGQDFNQQAAWPSVSERRFYDGHDRKVDGSTLALTSLRPWIRFFTIIISAWWNLTSSKLNKSEAKKTQLENKGNS